MAALDRPRLFDREARMLIAIRPDSTPTPATGWWGRLLENLMRSLAAVAV
jgi:hypothetical protein